MRWLAVSKSVLVCLFLSTLFFQVFFPDVNTCTSIDSQYLCESQKNKIITASLCSWDNKNEYCSLKEPSSSFLFLLNVALLCNLVGLPLDMFVGYIIDEYVNKQPKITGYFWRSPSKSQSDAVLPSSRGPLNSILYSIEVRERRQYSKDLERNLFSGNNAVALVDPNEKKIKEHSECSSIMYESFLSPKEEASIVMKFVQSLFISDIENGIWYKSITSNSKANTNKQVESELKTSSTMSTSSSTSLVSKVIKALTPREILLYNEASKRLSSSIATSRMQANRIVNHISQLNNVSAKEREKYQDTMLLQYFILDQ